eukprot:Hpha_TRINITY_DN17014_c1_g1::TRINITY_DN17014_c1_g1_i1::g.166675::m.166675
MLTNKGPVHGPNRRVAEEEEEEAGKLRQDMSRLGEEVRLAEQERVVAEDRAPPDAPSNQPPLDPAGSGADARLGQGLSEEAGPRPLASVRELVTMLETLKHFQELAYGDEPTPRDVRSDEASSKPVGHSRDAAELIEYLVKAVEETKRRIAAKVAPERSASRVGDTLMWDWLEALPGRWKEALPEDESQFELSDIHDNKIRRIGQSFYIPFLSPKQQECCETDPNKKPTEPPECTTCKSPKWQIQFGGFLRSSLTVLTRCLDQLKTVRQEHEHRLSEASAQAGVGLNTKEEDALRWQRKLLHMLPKDACEGIMAAFVYAYDLKKPHKETCSADADCGRHASPGPLACEKCEGGKASAAQSQLYWVLNKACREYGDPAVREKKDKKENERNRKVIQIFGALLWRCDVFLDSMKEPREGMLYRGINLRIAKKYDPGTLVPWPSLSSTSTDLSAARSFVGPSGSLFIIQPHEAADITFTSLFPMEAESLLPTCTVLEVGVKMNETLLAMMQCNYDVVFLAVREVGEAELTPEQIVRLRMRTMKEASVVMQEFLRGFVEPLIRVCPAADIQMEEGVEKTKPRPLFEVFDEWAADEHASPVMFMAPGGFGKTTVTLALTARMVGALNLASSKLMLRPAKAATFDEKGILKEAERLGMSEILKESGVLDDLCEERAASNGRSNQTRRRSSSAREDTGRLHQPNGIRPSTRRDPLWVSLPAMGDEVGKLRSMEGYLFRELHLDSSCTERSEEQLQAVQDELRKTSCVCFGDSVDEMRIENARLEELFTGFKGAQGEADERAARMNKSRAVLFNLD